MKTSTEEKIRDYSRKSTTLPGFYAEVASTWSPLEFPFLTKSKSGGKFTKMIQDTRNNMNTYNVRLKITGEAELLVDDESEDQAIDLAYQQVTEGDFTAWEASGGDAEVVELEEPESKE